MHTCFQNPIETTRNASTVDDGNSRVLPNALERSLLTTDPTMAWPYLVALCLSIVVGVPGNLLIVAASALNKELQVEAFPYMVNLAIADFLVVAVANPLCIVGKPRLIQCSVFYRKAQILYRGNLTVHPDFRFMQCNSFHILCNSRFMQLKLQIQIHILFNGKGIQIQILYNGK